jgi:hypothetical protein
MSDDFTTGTGFEDEIFSLMETTYSKLQNDDGGPGVNPLNQAPFGAVQPEQQSYHHEQTYHHNLQPAADNNHPYHPASTSKLQNTGVNPLYQAPFGAVQPQQQSYHQTYHHNLQPAAANHQMVHQQPSTCNQCCIELPLEFKYTLDKDGHQAKILSDMLGKATGQAFDPELVTMAWNNAAKNTSRGTEEMSSHEMLHFLRQRSSFKLNITDANMCAGSYGEIFKGESLDNIIRSFRQAYPWIQSDVLLDRLICLWASMTVHRTSDLKSEGIDLVKTFLTKLCSELNLPSYFIKFKETPGKQPPIARNLSRNFGGKGRSISFGSPDDWFTLFSSVTGQTEEDLKERLGNFRILKSAPRTEDLSRKGEVSIKMRSSPSSSSKLHTIVVPRGALTGDEAKFFSPYYEGDIQIFFSCKLVGLIGWAPTWKQSADNFGQCE